jgi:hypothetical protein
MQTGLGPLAAPASAHRLLPAGNDSLLQLYGFVEAGNPHDSYTLLDPWGRLLQVAGQVPAGVAPALQQALQRPLVLSRSSWPDREAVAALEQLLQLLRSSGQQVQQASGLQLLQALVAAELGSMASSLEQDSELLEGLLRLPGLQERRVQLEQQLQDAAQQQAALQEQQRGLLEAQEAAAGEAAGAEGQDAALQQQHAEELAAQLQGLAEALQEVRRQLDEVAADVQRIEALQLQNAGVPMLALSLRVEKKRMLQALCS